MSLSTTLIPLAHQVSFPITWFVSTSNRGNYAHSEELFHYLGEALWFVGASAALLATLDQFVI
jgi:hypothetical protein